MQGDYVLRIIIIISSHLSGIICILHVHKHSIYQPGRYEKKKHTNPSLLQATACTNENNVIITKGLRKQCYCYVANILQSSNHPSYYSRHHHGVHTLTMRPSLKAVNKESKMVVDAFECHLILSKPPVFMSCTRKLSNNKKRPWNTKSQSSYCRRRT